METFFVTKVSRGFLLKFVFCIFYPAKCFDEWFYVFSSSVAILEFLPLTR